MAQSRVGGGIGQSASSSSIFFQGDGQPQAIVNSHLSSSFGNSSQSLPGSMRSSLGLPSGDMNNSVLNSVANSGPSMGASSLVTDANSALSSGPHLQRSASINTDSYMRLPASPLSFSSNNLSVSGSSIVDCSAGVNHQDPSAQSVQPNHHHPSTSLQSRTNGHIPGPMGRASAQFLQDTNMAQLQKKQRLDMKQEDIIQQQVLHQMLQRQDSMNFPNRNPQLQTMLQHQRLHQQILQSLPPLQRVQLQQQQQQQQQMQFKQQQQQQQQMQPANALKRPFDSGVCSRRLMQYLYHQRQRPSENSIAYWRKFVAEYFSPRAKKRWCLSLYDNVGQHGFGVFPQASMEVWHCDICGSKSGRGFEATYDVLPRLNEIKFGSGVIDEHLFLELPRECRFPSGLMMVEYNKAVQESVYDHLRVIREGQLRIIFTQDLKILSWEFCARRHEELLPRRFVAPQVNQLVQVACKCQSTVYERLQPEGISQQDLQANSNMVLSAGRQLIKCLEIPALNDLGFSKRYVRCLQISEVVNTLKDLMDFCRDSKMGPMEGLKSFPRQHKLQPPKTEASEDLPLNKPMPMPNANPRAAIMLSRQNSMSSNITSDSAKPPHQAPSSSFVMPGQHSLNSNMFLPDHQSARPPLGYVPGPATSALAGLKGKVSDLPLDEELFDNAFFGNELEDTMGYAWKG